MKQRTGKPVVAKATGFALDGAPSDPDARLRWLRGHFYLAQTRYTRLCHAWPHPNEMQRLGIHRAWLYLVAVERHLQAAERDTP